MLLFESVLQRSAMVRAHLVGNCTRSLRELLFNEDGSSFIPRDSYSRSVQDCCC